MKKLKKKCHQYFHVLHYLKIKVRVSDFSHYSPRIHFFQVFSILSSGRSDLNGNSQILHSGFLKKLDFSNVLICFLWKRACEFYKHSFVA